MLCLLNSHSHFVICYLFNGFQGETGYGMYLFDGITHSLHLLGNFKAGFVAAFGKSFTPSVCLSALPVKFAF